MLKKACVVRQTLRTLFSVLRQAVEGFNRKGDAMLGGAIAFYSMLSAAPLLVVAVAVAGVVFGFDAARREVLGNARRFLGPEAAQYLVELMREAREPLASGLATLVGLAIIGFGATRLFVYLQRTLNHVMGVRVLPKKGLKRIAGELFKERAKSFAMVLGCGLGLTMLLLLRTMLTALNEWIEPIADLPWLWHLVEMAVSFTLLALLFAAIYKTVPDVYLTWKDVWLGGTLTAVLLGLGTLPIGWFLGRMSLTSAYGAAGTLVAVLLFVYYAAQIFFFGAEVTAAWAREQGGGVRPKPHAVRLVEASDDQSVPAADPP